jgi:hypothetical protein
MSQAGILNSSGGSVPSLDTLTGNSGGSVSPTANNIDTVGAGSITIVGNPGTSTLTTELTGLTNHNVLIGAGTATITNVAPSTAGFVLTSNGAAADPSFQAVTISGAVTTITGNSGGAESPLAGNFNILGTGSITIAGSPNTETVQLTGLTNHAILVGAGTATITKVGPSATTGQVLQNNAAADPSYSTATYPSIATTTGTILRADGTNWVKTTSTFADTYPASDLLYSNGANTVTGLATANQSVLTTTTAGIPTWQSMATDGAVLIGSTAGNPVAAVLTAGTGISIANGSNSITISAAASGFTWHDVTSGSATLAANNGYIADKSTLTTFTLPTNNAFGDEIKIVGKGSGGWTVVYGAGQNIILSSSTTTTTTGNLASTNQNDCCELVCTTASVTAPIFTVVSSIGNLAIT